MNIFWFFPIHGNSRYPGTRHGARRTDQAIDRLGLDGALISAGRLGQFGEVVADWHIAGAARS